jgi:hypothetical protein
LTCLDVRSEVQELLPEVQAACESFLKSLEPTLTKIVTPINVGCRSCEYRLTNMPQPNGNADERNGFKECWGDLATVDTHLLDFYHVSGIGNGQLVNDLITRAQVRLEDVREEDLVRQDGTPGPINVRQRIQREYTLANQEYLSADLLKCLTDLRYPLHFIDFETSRVAVPYHAGMRPYENVAFQWSCHTIREKGAPPEHTEWINIVDVFPNFAFAESLMNQLAEKGTFLTWSHHENTVLNEIRAQMRKYSYSDPELERWLDTVPKHDGNDSKFIADMCKLAKAGYFHPKMKGKLSLKYVLPAVWESSETLRRLPEFAKYHRRDESGQLLNPYDTLPPLPFGNPDDNGSDDKVVTEGTGAMRAYQEMLYGVSRHDEAIKEKWRNLLLQYCELDTAAMVMVWMHWTNS